MHKRTEQNLRILMLVILVSQVVLVSTRTKNLGAIGKKWWFVITNNKVIYEKIKILIYFGWKKRFNSSIKGLNSRLDEIQKILSN